MTDDWRQRIDLDRYLRDRVRLINPHGGRGYDQGIRIFDCPFCGDTRGRGWLNVIRWTAGCWNSGCEAEPRLSGALDWARRQEGYRTRGQTWAFLLADYPGSSPIPALPEEIDDFVKLPEMTPIGAPRVLCQEASEFALRQWGLSRRAGHDQWGLGVVDRGRFAYRIIIPIVENKIPIAFTARTFRNGTPKYLAAEQGKDCGRHMGQLLFNLDSVSSDRPVLMMEGAGDVMAWEERPEAKDLAPVGLMGTALTPERLAMLSLRKVPLVIVALDEEEAARQRALAHIEDLETWGIKATLGSWRGGKDAGSGARLAWSWSPEDRDLSVRMRQRLGLS